MSKLPFQKVVVFFCLIGFSFSFTLCSEQKVKIIKKDAGLKTLPQVESPTIVGLPLGAEFSIAERISEEWIKISLPPNKDGIVQSGYVQVSFIKIIDVAGYRIDSKDAKLAQEYPPNEIFPNVPSDSRYFDWQSEYSAAKSRRSRWTGVTVLGGIALVGGVAWLLYEDVSFIRFPEYYDPNPRHAPAACWIVSGIGLTIAVAGFIGWSSAGQYVRNLESEGKTKGYIKIQAGILPKYRSVGVQLSFGF